MGLESIITRKDLTTMQATISVKDQAVEGFWVEDNAN